MLFYLFTCVLTNVVSSNFIHYQYCWQLLNFLSDSHMITASLFILNILQLYSFAPSLKCIHLKTEKVNNKKIVITSPRDWEGKEIKAFLSAICSSEALRSYTSAMSKLTLGSPLPHREQTPVFCVLLKCDAIELPILRKKDGSFVEINTNF